MVKAVKNKTCPFVISKIDLFLFVWDIFTFYSASNTMNPHRVVIPVVI